MDSVKCEALLTAACLPGRRKALFTTGFRWPGMSFLSGCHRRMLPQAGRIFRFPN